MYSRRIGLQNKVDEGNWFVQIFLSFILNSKDRLNENKEPILGNIKKSQLA
jgi:hypothetical protein